MTPHLTLNLPKYLYRRWRLKRPASWDGSQVLFHGTGEQAQALQARLKAQAKYAAKGLLPEGD